MIRRICTLGVAIAVVTASLLGFVGQAAAQSDDRIAANLDDGGVFVEDGADGTADGFIDVIERLDRIGLDLHIASLADDDPNVEGLARSLMDKTGGTVLVITPGQLAGASDVYNDTQVGRAIDASIDEFGDVVAGALAFGEALAGETTSPVGVSTSAAPTTTPPSTESGGDDGAATTATTTPAARNSGGDGGGGFWIFLLIVAVVIVGAVLFVRSRNRKNVKTELESRRMQVAEELEAIGVEIVDISDAMSVNDDPEPTRHYRQANEQFLDLKDRLDQAASLWEVTEIDHEADTAAWHLDAAVVLLDDKPIPAMPERPTEIEPSPEAEGDDSSTDRPGANDDAGGRTRRTERERVDSRLDRRERSSSTPSPRQRSREQRRTGWSPPKTTGTGSRGGLGKGLGGLLGKVLVGGMLGGGGRSRPPRSWNGSGTVSGSPRPTTSRATPRRQRQSGGVLSGTGSASRRSGGSASRSRSSSSRSSGSSSRKRSSGSGGSASRDR